MSQPEIQFSKSSLDHSGVYGTLALSPAVTNKIVTSTNMKVGTYTVAAQPVTPAILSAAVTTVSGADTMGTITIVGTDIFGAALTETITPVSGSTVYTTNMFKTVTSVTGAGWVINTTADTIIVGTAGIVAPTGYYFSSMSVMSAAVVSAHTDKSGVVPALLTGITSIPVSTYPVNLTAITLSSGLAMMTLGRL